MRIIIGLMLLALLGGCSSNRPQAERAASIYDLGAPPQRPMQAVLPRAALEVHLPIWFDEAPMRYRLHYHNAAKMQEYVSARWAAPPSQLLQQRLRLQLGLPAAQAAGEAACLIVLDIDEFSHSFASPTASSGQLLGEARLFDRSRRRLLGGFRFNVAQPAPTPDAVGGVQALSAATDRLALQLREWLSGPGAGATEACRAP